MKHCLFGINLEIQYGDLKQMPALITLCWKSFILLDETLHFVIKFLFHLG